MSSELAMKLKAVFIRKKLMKNMETGSRLVMNS